MATTVADQVVRRVEALVRAGEARTRAEAIRAVAAEMDRSVAATSSAYYAGRRAAAAADEVAAASTAGRGPRAARGSRARSSDVRLFAEMLPLVEAGATIEQAARRFGDDDEADAIAAGFTRWLLAERERADGPAEELAEARRRIAALEGEARGLRRDLTRAHRALGRVRVIADDLLGDDAP
ncbi:MAG: hypothetical protein AB7V62_06940 [Thermoleophilia bacterium]